MEYDYKKKKKKKPPSIRVAHTTTLRFLVSLNVSSYDLFLVLKEAAVLLNKICLSFWNLSTCLVSYLEVSLLNCYNGMDLTFELQFWFEYGITEGE
jgi:hypothetical protein